MATNQNANLSGYMDPAAQAAARRGLLSIGAAPTTPAYQTPLMSRGGGFWAPSFGADPTASPLAAAPTPAPAVTPPTTPTPPLANDTTGWSGGEQAGLEGPNGGGNDPNHASSGSFMNDLRDLLDMIGLGGPNIGSINHGTPLGRAVTAAKNGDDRLDPTTIEEPGWTDAVDTGDWTDAPDDGTGGWVDAAPDLGFNGSGTFDSVSGGKNQSDRAGTGGAPTATSARDDADQASAAAQAQAQAAAAQQAREEAAREEAAQAAAAQQAQAINSAMGGGTVGFSDTGTQTGAPVEMTGSGNNPKDSESNASGGQGMDGGDGGQGGGDGGGGSGSGQGGANEAGGSGGNGGGGMEGGGGGGMAKGGSVTPAHLLPSVPPNQQAARNALAGIGQRRPGNLATGGPVTPDQLGGPNPPGPDDGFTALDQGEFVVNADQAQKPGNAAALQAMNQGADMPAPGALGGGVPDLSIAAGPLPTQMPPTAAAPDDMGGGMPMGGDDTNEGDEIDPDTAGQNLAALDPQQRQALAQAVSDPLVANALVEALGAAFVPVVQQMAGGVGPLARSHDALGGGPNGWDNDLDGGVGWSGNIAPFGGPVPAPGTAAPPGFPPGGAISPTALRAAAALRGIRVRA